MAQNIFFTADTHFNHDAVIRFCNRPFESVEDMNERLIENWNSIIKKQDTVYHLGDFAWRKPEDIIDRLNGQIHLILGNHDRLNLAMKKKFVSISDIKICKTVDPHIVLCHYALRTWNKSIYGIGHLYGHSHGNLPEYGKSFDIGVDSWDYYPVPYDKVKEKMERLAIKAEDHHIKPE